jgi:lysophospholipase L1-like esterase
MVRYSSLVLCAVALGACQTNGGSTSPDGSLNQAQNVAVPLGNPTSPNATTQPNSTVDPTVPPVATNQNATLDTNQVTGPTGASATFDANGVQFLGRVPTATSVLSWPGSGVVATFNGTSAQLSFTPRSGTSYVGVSIDGGPFTKVMANGNNTIGTGTLRNGTHTVTAVKLNETSLGLLKFNGISTRSGLVQTAAPTRRIEFVGDSITVGYGIEGTSPCTNNASLENATKTYGALTADTLGAHYDLVAWSGKGMLRNAASVGTDVSPTMPMLWTRLAANDGNSLYDFPVSRAPDAVVINLGTNDFTYIGYDAAGNSSTVRGPLVIEEFTAAYETFVKTVRQRYPNAWLVLCTSPMLNDTYPSAAEAQHTAQLGALKKVAADLADAKLSVLDFPSQTVGAGLNGCDSHPSTAQHQAMATQLVQELKLHLGW